MSGKLGDLSRFTSQVAKGIHHKQKNRPTRRQIYGYAENKRIATQLEAARKRY